MASNDVIKTINIKFSQISPTYVGTYIGQLQFYYRYL